MPEEQNITGNNWHKKVNALLKSAGWKQGGDSNVDIYSSNIKKSYGIDSYFTYFDPYEDDDIGIFVEAKSRKWQSINKSFIEDTVETLIGKIQEIPLCPEFNNKLNFSKAKKANTGFILLNASDHYHHEEYLKSLCNIKQFRRRNLQRIFIASNEDIKRINTVINIYNDLKTSEECQNIQFYYPSFNIPKNKPYRLEHLTLEYMFSNYIFVKMSILEKISKNQILKEITVVFCLENICLPSLELLYDALIRFQLLEADEVRIYFYQDYEKERSSVEEFLRTKGKEKNVVFNIFKMGNFGCDINGGSE